MGSGISPLDADSSVLVVDWMYAASSLLRWFFRSR